MGFWDRLTRGISTGHGGGHHEASRSQAHGGGHGSHGGHGGGNYQPGPAPPPQAVPAATTSGLRCSQCGVEGAPGARFCAGCGGQLVANSCQGCGTMLAPGAKYCSQCGKPSA